jgi:amino acid transporter
LIGARLRRDLGTIEAYAAFVGVLTGAGIFRVTSSAWAITGPSLILAYLVLAPAVLATSIPYAVFLSTPLGRDPGGEYTHISRTFGGTRVAFVGTWLKIISYIGALAFLANAFADYAVQLAGGRLEVDTWRFPIAVGILTFIYLVHVLGIRWFGRVQVTMCALLGLSLVVLIVPGLFAIRFDNYRPFFTHGAGGFAAALLPLFFAYAGFESLAQAAGEVRDSTSRLPRVFIRGIFAATGIFFLMSAVAFGVLPGSRLENSTTPMADVAAVYLPAGGSAFVTFGALMALATTLNMTMLVPSRVGIILARDHLAPAWLGAISPRTGTPIRGLTITFMASVLLLASGQLSLALTIAVFALVILYFLHAVALLALPRANPELYRQVTVPIRPAVQRFAAIVSIVSMGALIVMQVVADLRVLATQSFAERIAGQSLTSLELTILWSVIGVAIYSLGRRRAAGDPCLTRIDGDAAD